MAEILEGVPHYNKGAVAGSVECSIVGWPLARQYHQMYSASSLESN